MAADGAMQRCLYEKLSGALELTALLGGTRIYHTSRRARTLPCVTLGQTVNVDWSTVTQTGSDITLHIWTSADSATEVHEIILTVWALLDGQPLTRPDREPANLRYEFTQVRIDPDGETLHGIARYNAETEPFEADAFDQAAA